MNGNGSPGGVTTGRLTFRDAIPEDAAFAASLIYGASPAVFDYIMCTDDHDKVIEILSHQFVSRFGVFSHRHFLAALVDGVVVGMGTGHTGKGFNLRTIGSTFVVLRHWGSHTAGMLRRGLEANEITPNPDRSEYYIRSVGVDPSERGQGVGVAIMSKMIERAKQSGATKATLDVSTRNPAAQQLYESLGFSVVAEYPCPLPKDRVDVPDHRRMSIDLATHTLPSS